MKGSWLLSSLASEKSDKSNWTQNWRLISSSHGARPKVEIWPFRLVLDQKQCSILSLKKIDSILSSKAQCSFWAALSIEPQKLSAESWEIETALNRGILSPLYFGMLRHEQRSQRDEHCNCLVRWNLRRREWTHSSKDSPRSSGGHCLVAGTDTRPLGDQVSRSTSGLCSLSVPAIYTGKKSFNQSINQSTTQSINQPLNLSINQSSIQSSIQSINQSINQSTTQSINQSINQGHLKSWKIYYTCLFVISYLIFFNRTSKLLSNVNSPNTMLWSRSRNSIQGSVEIKSLSRTEKSHRTQFRPPV